MNNELDCTSYDATFRSGKIKLIKCCYDYFDNLYQLDL